MKTDVVDRLEAVGVAAWDHLVAQSRLGSPFLTWTWQREWTRAFAADRRLEIRRVEDAEGRLVALLPLHEAAPGVLTLIGGADISDYLDLIALAGREEEAWMALLQSRAAERVAWGLHPVPGASPTGTVLPQLAPARGLSASVAIQERCPGLALPSSWDAYLTSLSGKHRHELARKMRRLERETPEARAVCASRPADVENRLGDVFDPPPAPPHRERGLLGV